MIGHSVAEAEAEAISPDTISEMGRCFVFYHGPEPGARSIFNGEAGDGFDSPKLRF